MHARRLEGQVAFITGAASGIGYACARRFVAEGAIVIGADVNPAAHWCQDVGPAPAAECCTLDVCDLAATEAAVQRIVRTHGRLDIVVTAAGIASGGPVHALAVEEWDRVQQVLNLKGTFLSIKAALPPMMERRCGSIITIASVEGLDGSEAGSTHNASKGGVVLLTKNR